MATEFSHLNRVSISVACSDMGRRGAVIGRQVWVAPGADEEPHDAGVSPAGGVIHRGQAQLVANIDIDTGDLQEPLYDLLKRQVMYVCLTLVFTY